VQRSYDAVVVGAGLGGMSAATFLARSGKQVLLLERHHVPGGYASSFRRGRFEFDASLHVLSGIGLPGKRGRLYEYLDFLGVAGKLEFIPLKELYRVVDERIDVTLPPEWEGTIDTLCDRFPGEAGQIREFFALMKRLARDLSGLFMAANRRATDLTPESFPDFARWGMKTYGDILAGFFRDEDLKSALSPFWSYLGLPPSKVPFHMMASCWDALLKQHPVHIRGRNQALSNAFVETLVECGGEARFGCGVRRIVLKDGAVRAVVTDEGEEVETRVVVSNASIPSTLGDLVGGEHVPEGYRRQVNSRQAGFSTVNVYAGLDCPPEAVGAKVHENFIDFGRGIEEAWATAFTLGAPRGMLFTSYTSSDPGFSPPGTSAMVLTAASYARPWYLVPPERYVDAKNAFAAAMFERAERYFPGLRDRLEVVEVATPLTNMRYTGNPGGAIYGFDQYLSDSGLLRLGNRSPVGGLYFASAWTLPGGGYQTCMTSGFIAGGMALKKLQ
jgi:phytoene dehydrogenase-like protein